MKKLELFRPVKPLGINQYFGSNAEYYKKEFKVNGHNGIDFQAYHGQPVRAAHDGIVSYAGMDGGEGYGVVIRTEDERRYAGNESYWKTIYWHLLPNIPVKINEKVRIGQIIGYADNTGKSTGDHLHFGLKPIGKGENEWTWYNFEQQNGYLGAVDPLEAFNGIYAEEAFKIIDQIALIRKKVEELVKLIFKK